MTNVKTNIDHDIDDNIFKELISKTSQLIRYEGNDYITRLKQLNDEYSISTVKQLTEKQFAQNLNKNK